MAKIRRIVVALSALLYIILIVARVNISRNLYILLLGIILANQAVDEWNKYLVEKNKFYLIIPVLSLVIIVFAIFQLVKGF